MSHIRPSAHTIRLLSLIAGAVGIVCIINPITSLNLLLVAALALVVGHIFLQEKLLLVFMCLRPTLDYWRDVTVFRYQETTVNVNAALAILFLAWSCLMFVRHRKAITTIPGVVILSLTGAYLTLSTLWSISPLTTLIESIKFLNILAFFGLSYICVKTKLIRVQEVIITLFASGIIPILVALGQIINQTGLTTIDLPGRIYGTFAHPNVFAFFILGLIILHLHTSKISPALFWKNHPHLPNILLGIGIILLLLTYTRAAWIGLAVFITVIGFVAFRRLLLVVVGGGLLVYVLLFPVNNWLRANTTYDLTDNRVLARLISRNEDADSVSWRFTLIRETAPLIMAKPITGYGFGTFPLVWESNRSLRHLWDDSAESHNDYLRLALETGWPGLTLYGALLLTLLYYSYRLLRVPHFTPEYLHLTAWILVFMVVSFSDNMLHHTPVMWGMWAWWGTMLAVPHKKGDPNLIDTSF